MFVIKGKITGKSGNSVLGPRLIGLLQIRKKRKK